MGNKHRWYDVIVAWANGEKIQFKDIGCYSTWKDCDLFFRDTPEFHSTYYTWRVKPKTVNKRYRMALVKWGSLCITTIDVTNSTLDDPAEYDIAGFIRWVGDAVEVEIESDC